MVIFKNDHMVENDHMVKNDQFGQKRSDIIKNWSKIVIFGQKWPNWRRNGHISLSGQKWSYSVNKVFFGQKW